MIVTYGSNGQDYIVHAGREESSSRKRKKKGSGTNKYCITTTNLRKCVTKNRDDNGDTQTNSLNNESTEFKAGNTDMNVVHLKLAAEWGA